MTANATPAELVTHRALVERLVDDLDQIATIVWADRELDRDDLRRRVDAALMLACVELDGLANR